MRRERVTQCEPPEPDTLGGREQSNRTRSDQACRPAKALQIDGLTKGDPKLLEMARELVSGENGVAIYSAAEGGAPPEADQLSAAAIAQVVEERLAQFAQQPKVFIRDTERDVLGDAARNDGIATSGMVYQGDIYLFLDGLTDTAAVSRTVWHELLHYGLRRFLTGWQYIAKMGKSYMKEDDFDSQGGVWQ